MTQLSRSFLFAALTVLPLLAGAQTVPNTSGLVYSDRGALTQQTATLAKVVAIRQVQIQVQPNGHTALYLGTAVGAAGGYLVTQHSQGTVRGLGTILGGVAGGAIANGVANRPSIHPGVQIFVQRLDGYGRPNSGQLTSVVQDDDQRMRVGQQVLLVRSRDGFTVAPVDASAAMESQP
jgi:outer membrane lipoprotein SlyB